VPSNGALHSAALKRGMLFETGSQQVESEDSNVLAKPALVLQRAGISKAVRKKASERPQDVPTQFQRPQEVPNQETGLEIPEVQPTQPCRPPLPHFVRGSKTTTATTAATATRATTTTRQPGTACVSSWCMGPGLVPRRRPSPSSRRPTRPALPICPRTRR